MFLNGFFQNAYVTRNLEKAMTSCRERYGIKDFIRFDPDMEVDTAYGRGRCVVKVALAWAGNLQIELIEPVSGLVQHYRDYLPTNDSPRLHHIAIRVDDWDATRAEISREKWPVAYEGAFESAAKFVYVDARDSLGHYVEYMWASPEMWTSLGGR